MSEPGFAPSNMNGRYGGGSGSEHRYSRPSVDADRWDEANYGATDVDGRWTNALPERVAASKINTMDMPTRGTLAGAVLESGDHAPSNPSDRGGFC
jgi:hypothetical protein